MISNAPLVEFLTALADDELLIGHRDAEWTGYAPILEEDIAFSNIAQDEIGHGLVWYSLLEPMTGKTPDQMGFERPSADFRCCRFVTYPRGDFAYTVMRQYLYDEAEQVRLESLVACPSTPVRDAAAKILQEEAYHLLHSKGLVLRLGSATEESHGRMAKALADAFPQALGMFEPLNSEGQLIEAGIFPGNASLRVRWMDRILPVLRQATIPVESLGSHDATMKPDLGGRRGDHLPHLAQALSDLQSVYQSEKGASW